ncbi:hypothetical protein WMF30_20490 [Sorangium sp. So ce134]
MAARPAKPWAAKRTIGAGEARMSPAQRRDVAAQGHREARGAAGCVEDGAEPRGSDYFT